MDARDLLLTAAERLETLAARTTPGEWRLGGLLASRPEVIAHGAAGGTEHVADARAGTGEWITALSPAVAPALVAWLRSAAGQQPVEPTACAVAEVLLDRLPARGRPDPRNDEASNY